MSHRTSVPRDRVDRILETDGLVPTTPGSLSPSPPDRSHWLVLLVGAIVLGLAVIAIAVGLLLTKTADQQAKEDWESASPPLVTIDQNDSNGTPAIPAPAAPLAVLDSGAVVVVEVSDRPGNGPGIDRITLRNATEATLDVSGWEV